MDRSWGKHIVVILVLALFVPFSVAHSEEGKAKDFKFTIDKTNADQYKESLPAGLYFQIKNWGRKINVYETINDYVFPKEYREMTEKYKGTARVNSKGGLENYKGGVPFPDPKTGFEVAYNFENRYKGADHFVHGYDMMIVSTNGKVRTMKGSAMFLTPSPGSDFSSKSINGIISPEDVAGLKLLTFRYRDPDKKDDTWMYVPSIRRMRRISTAQRGDSSAGTDWTWDDAQGFDAKISDFNWKFIGKKKIFTNFHGPERGYQRDGFVFRADEVRFELRDVYVVEAVNKAKDYVYSKALYYFDAECLFVSGADHYDKKGNLWKYAEVGYAVRKNGEINVNNFYMADLIGHKVSMAQNLVFKYNNGFKEEQFSTTSVQSMQR